MFEQAAQFLASVVPWPTPGWVDTPPWFVNIHWKVEIQENGKTRIFFPGRACTQIEQAINALEYRLSQDGGTDLYVCMSGQAVGKEKLDRRGRKYWNAARSLQNAVYLKSLWIDVDVKEKGFATTEEAAQAFAIFRDAVGLPPASWVVLSGSGGFHVHWSLSEPISAARWLALASKLSAAMQAKAFSPIDYGVSTDAARLLRVPNTFNYKTIPPKPTLLQVARGTEYRPEYLEEILAPYTSLPAAQIQRRITTPGGRMLDPALFPPRPPLAYSSLGAGIQRNTIDKDQLAAVCPLVDDALTHGGNTHRQPLWHALATLAVRLVDGRDAFHEMSDGHPDYDEDKTDDLYDRVDADHFRRDTGWTTCAHFQSAGSLQCGGCAHRLEGKSPLNFVQRYLPPPPVPVSPLPTPVAALARLRPSWLPQGYRALTDRTIVRDIPSTPDKPAEIVKVFEHPVIEPWLQEGDPSRGGGDAVNFTSSFGSRPRDVQVTMGNLASNERLSTALSEAGVPTIHIPEARRFFVAFLTTLRERKERAIRTERFGWTTDDDGEINGFAYGGKCYMPTGELPVVIQDRKIARDYTPVGSIEPWKLAVEQFISTSCAELEWLLVTPFAAPLMRFTNHSGLMISAFSIASGRGKTTALTLSQTAVGAPKAMATLRDTVGSIVNKLGQLNNLPAFFDEVRGDRPEKYNRDQGLARLPLLLSQGREPARLTRNVQQRETPEWQTMLASGSNMSLIDYVNAHNTETAAGMMRIFEFEVPAAPAGRSSTLRDMNNLMLPLSTNYGHAFAIWAKYLGENAQLMKQRVNACENRLLAIHNFDDDERFWLSAISLHLVAAMTVRELGLVKFDVERLKKFAYANLAKLRIKKKLDTLDFADDRMLRQFIEDFIADNRHRIITTDSIPMSGVGGRAVSNLVGVPDPYMRDRWAGRFGVNQRLLWLDNVVFSDWLKKKDITPANVTKGLMTFPGARNVRAVITKGIPLVKPTSQVHILEYDCNTGPLQDLFN